MPTATTDSAPTPEPCQVAGQPIRPGVKLRVGQLDTVRQHRHRVRRRGHPLREQFQHRPRRHRKRRSRSTSAAPGPARRASITGTARTRVAGAAASGPGPRRTSARAVRRRRFEQVRGRRHRPAQPGRSCRRPRTPRRSQVEVARGTAAVARLSRHPPVRSGFDGPRRRPVVLQGQHDLEQRVPGQRPRPARAPRPGARTARPGAPSAARRVSRTRARSSPERRVAGHVGAHHQGVDEEADQVVEGLVGAAGDGRTRSGCPCRRPAGTAAPPGPPAPP